MSNSVKKRFPCGYFTSANTYKNFWLLFSDYFLSSNYLTALWFALSCTQHIYLEWNFIQDLYSIVLHVPLHTYLQIWNSNNNNKSLRFLLFPGLPIIRSPCRGELGWWRFVISQITRALHFCGIPICQRAAAAAALIDIWLQWHFSIWHSLSLSLPLS